MCSLLFLSSSFHYILLKAEISNLSFIWIMRMETTLWGWQSTEPERAQVLEYFYIVKALCHHLLSCLKDCTWKRNKILSSFSCYFGPLIKNKNTQTDKHPSPHWCSSYTIEMLERLITTISEGVLFCLFVLFCFREGEGRKDKGKGRESQRASHPAQSSLRGEGSTLTNLRHHDLSKKQEVDSYQTESPTCPRVVIAKLNVSSIYVLENHYYKENQWMALELMGGSNTSIK